MIRNKHRSISTNPKIHSNYSLPLKKESSSIIENQTQRIDSLLMKEIGKIQINPSQELSNTPKKVQSFRIKNQNGPPSLQSTDKKNQQQASIERELNFNRNKFAQIQQLYLGSSDLKNINVSIDQSINIDLKVNHLSKNIQNKSNETINLINQEKDEIVITIQEINKKIQKIQKNQKDIKGRIFQLSQKEELNSRLQEEIVDSKEQKCKQIDQIINTQKNFIHEKLAEYLAEKQQIEQQTNTEIIKLKKEEVIVKKELEFLRSKDEEHTQMIRKLQQDIRNESQLFLEKVQQIIDLPSCNKIDDQYFSLLDQGIQIKLEYLPKDMNVNIRDLYFQKINLEYKINKMNQIRKNPVDFLKENPNITSANFDYKVDFEKNRKKIGFLEQKLVELNEKIFTEIIKTYEKGYPKYKQQIELEVQRYLTPSKMSEIDQKIKQVRESWYRF